MNIHIPLFLLLAALGIVLGAIAVWLIRIKRHEEHLLTRKTRQQVKLMNRHHRGVDGRSHPLDAHFMWGQLLIH